MNPALEINPHDGSIHVESCSLVIQPGLASGKVKEELATFYRRSVDHKNGYVWLTFQGFKFGERPCGIAACFYSDRLTEVHFGVSPACDGNESGGWPTREAIDEEVKFVRSVLAEIFGVSFESGSQRFKWGDVWSMFDPKGFIASSGIRYAA